MIAWKEYHAQIRAPHLNYEVYIYIGLFPSSAINQLLKIIIHIANHLRYSRYTYQSCLIPWSMVLPALHQCLKPNSNPPLPQTAQAQLYRRNLQTSIQTPIMSLMTMVISELLYHPLTNGDGMTMVLGAKWMLPFTTHTAKGISNHCKHSSKQRLLRIYLTMVLQRFCCHRQLQRSQR